LQLHLRNKGKRKPKDENVKNQEHHHHPHPQGLTMLKQDSGDTYFDWLDSWTKSFTYSLLVSFPSNEGIS